MIQSLSYPYSQVSLILANFCNECFVWPVYPRTCNNKKITNCIAMYTDDFACGTDWYMYEAMVQEGHDARMLSFQPNSPYGGHSNPQNFESWLVGCLGIVDSLVVKHAFARMDGVDHCVNLIPARILILTVQEMVNALLLLVLSRPFVIVTKKICLTMNHNDNYLNLQIVVINR